MTMTSRFVSSVVVALAGAAAFAAPMRDWDWHMPGEVYRDLEFSDRAGVDRATRFFQDAVSAEWRGTKVTDLVPLYRNAEGEWRKVQVKGESGEINPALLAYAVFMQGYSCMQARDRNKAIKLFEEVIDLYPEQKFISVPTRYMLAAIRREMGDLRLADEAIDAIADDPEAEGHVIFYNALRDRAWNRLWKGKLEDARDDFSRIVYSPKKVDGGVRNSCRGTLISLRVALGEFDELEKDVFSGTGKSDKDRRNTLTGLAGWFAGINGDNHEVARFVNVKYPRDKKAKAYRSEMEKIKKEFVTWFDNESHVFKGDGDGWNFAIVQMRVHAVVEKPDAVLKRVQALEPLVRSSKGATRNARAVELSGMLAGFGQKAAAFAAIDLAEGHPFKLRQYAALASRFGDTKACVAYLEEFLGLKPAPDPGEVKSVKYQLAGLYRGPMGQPEKAIKIYLEIDEPPGTVWLLADTYRGCGKKKEGYQCLTEIISAFPNDAPGATLRMAQWREADGEKERAIGLYRQILAHPKWKERGESSAAHQALERLGIATGGAMTNQVR